MVIHHAHGWLKEKIDALLLARKPACIATNEFNNEMQSFLPRCDFKTMVASMAGLPSAEEVAAEKIRTYVRQLGIISQVGPELDWLRDDKRAGLSEEPHSTRPWRHVVGARPGEEVRIDL